MIKARKAESIAQTREGSEQPRSTCDRLRNHRNELQDELDELTERYDELARHLQGLYQGQGVDRPRGPRSTSPVNPTTSSDAVTETKISRKEAETISMPSWPKMDQLDMWKGKLLSNALATPIVKFGQHGLQNPL